MDKETFSFELVDKDKPEIVIKNSLRQIDEATRGYVKGNIEKYESLSQEVKDDNIVMSNLIIFSCANFIYKVVDVFLNAVLKEGYIKTLLIFLKIIYNIYKKSF